MEMEQSILPDLTAGLRGRLEGLAEEGGTFSAAAKTLLSGVRLNLGQALSYRQRAMSLASELEDRVETLQQVDDLLEGELKRAELERSKYMAAIGSDKGSGC